MSNTSSISYINKLLENPQHITDAESARIEELLKAYPYFVPAHYLKAALRHKHEPFAKDLVNNARLYGANWLLFYEMLQKAEGVKEIPVAETTIPKQETNDTEPITEKKQEEEVLIQPVYTEDYFRHQGVHVPDEIPAEIEQSNKELSEDEKAQSLMVMMSFSEWLTYFKKNKEKEQEEKEDQKALKTMWQKEKLAAALEEENDEIPENVFEMAVNSIAKEDDLASESLADIYIKQGKYDKAIDMYNKLSLRNPQKKAYFARKIEAVLKEKQ